MGRRSKSHKQRVQAIKIARQRKGEIRKVRTSGNLLLEDYKNEESVEEEDYGIHVQIKEEVITNSEDNCENESEYYNYGDDRSDEDLNEDEDDQEEKREVKQVKVVNSKGHCDNHCLLCYQPIKRNQTPVLTNDAAKANHEAMCILQKMLQVPRHKLIEYLRHVGSPSEWIVFCRKCLSLVDKALKLENEICRLEEKLRKCQEEMLEEIKSSWREEEQLVGIQKSSFAIPASTLKIIRATNDIRHFVQSRGSIIIDNEEVEEDEGPESYEMQRRLRAPPPQTPCDSEDDGDDERSEGESPPKKTVYVSISSSEIGNQDNPQESKTPVIMQCPFEKYPAPSGEERSDDDDFDDGRTSPSDNPVSVDGFKPRIKHRERKVIARDTAALNEDNYSCLNCPNLGAMSLHNFMYHGLFHFRRPLKCTECGLYFSNSSEIEKTPFPKDSHVCSSDTLVKISFLPGNIWECSKCSEKFPSDLERDSHETNCDATNAINVNLIYSCGIYSHEISCDGSASKEVDLIYSCGSCSKQFRNMAERLLHRVLEHPKEASQGCLVCDKSFGTLTVEGVPIPDVPEIHRHLKRRHKYYRQYRIPNDCDFCGANFTHSTELQGHLEGTHGLTRNAAYLCPICYTRYPQSHLLRKHLTQNHKLGGQHLPTKETFVCDVCGYSTKCRRGYSEHKFSKHGVDPEGRHSVFKCSKGNCAFRTLLQENFVRHLSKEHGEKRKWICELCGKGFLTSSHLKRHEEIHRNNSAGLKPFQCEICGNSFAVRNYLYIHMRLSHQNRPFASTNKRKPSRKRRRVQQSNEIPPTTPTPTASSHFAEPTDLNLNQSQSQGIQNQSLIFSENTLANLTSL